MYSYLKSKKDINEIFDSKIDIKSEASLPASDSDYTYENGIKTWVSSIFIDIVNSTQYFNNQNISENILARIVRAFISELVKILADIDDYHEIGIRGDSVYAIYKASLKANLIDVFKVAYRVNTFLKMFNRLLAQRNWPLIKAGIGLGCDIDLVIKAGAPRKANDKIWIGHAVFDASNLSKIANRNGKQPICMNSLFYLNVIDLLKKENESYLSWITKAYSYDFKGDFYQCDIVQKNFDDWIDGGMKDE